MKSAEVVAIAIDSLGSTDPRHEEALAELAMADPLDDDDVHTKLERLAQIDGFDSRCEERKLRLLEIESLLAELPADATYGLLALSEFWITHGSPSDSPHVVQGVGADRTSPTDYYTARHYEEALDMHRQWLAQERADLRERCSHNAAGPDPRAIPPTPTAP